MACKTRTGRFTGQVICTACAPDCEHYLCTHEDEPTRTCRHCRRTIVYDRNDGWVDPEATGDDSVWRETCDAHDTFEADHEPDDERTGS